MSEKYNELRISANTDEEAIRRLIDIVELLRSECPWDREQTHQSLKTCMLEEAYEAVEAIKNCDMANLREELGDVLLQVVFHALLAKENDQFAFLDVVNEECEKMIRRHPHIFSEENIKSVDKVLEKWENMKRKEKGTNSQSRILSTVPIALPALTRSYKIQEKAAQVGFDWTDVSEAFKKIKEETEEFLIAVESNDEEHMAEEMGDLLFSVVNVARFYGINPEAALTSTSDKFINRFSHIEERANERGLSLEEMTLEEMDELWEEVKLLEKLK